MASLGSGPNEYKARSSGRMKCLKWCSLWCNAQSTLLWPSSSNCGRLSTAKKDGNVRNESPKHFVKENITFEGTHTYQKTKARPILDERGQNCRPSHRIDPPNYPRIQKYNRPSTPCWAMDCQLPILGLSAAYSRSKIPEKWLSDKVYNKREARLM